MGDEQGADVSEGVLSGRADVHPPCPRCRSAKTVPIAYGEPGPEMWEAAERNEVALGGCMVGDETDSCETCHFTFDRGVDLIWPGYEQADVDDDESGRGR